MKSLLLVLFLLLLTHFTSNTFSLCNPHETSALIDFKNSFFVNTSSILDDTWLFKCFSFSFKTESWTNNKDCCEWDGVTCDNLSDYVIGLDLSCNNLRGKLHPNSTLFTLRHLQHLNLAFNDFSMSSLHVGVRDLVNLMDLNLSHCNLTGNIPSTISHLSKLVSLDLSINDMELNPFTWKKLIHNITNLRELYLDNVNMSSIRKVSLSKLNNLSSSLVSLSLSSTGLEGILSSDILSLSNLQKLDLSGNEYLSGQLPMSNWSTPLRYLNLFKTSFSGEIPYSIGQLKSLTHLVLSFCNFDGFIPLSLSNLTQLKFLLLAENNLKGEIPDVFESLFKLEHLSLSYNNLVGQVPLSLFHLPQLSFVRLSSNKFVGPIPIEVTDHSKLRYVELNDNMFNGTIPRWCYYLPSLLSLKLEDNNLTGFIDDFSTYSLKYLFLSNNNFHGHFPNSIFQLQNLTYLDLSSTNLSGIVHFHQFSTFQNLVFLNLSDNSALSINIDGKAQTISPYLEFLSLSSTNINNFPKFLPPLPNLIRLDLSNNNIHGEIPKFLPPLPNLQILDLSNNNIHGKIPKWFRKHLLNTWKNIQLIDLSLNKLQGDLPIPPYGIRYFLLSNNNFTGDIDLSLCNASSLEMLDLAHNNLTGTIPQCMGTFPSLSILDMQMNNLYGSIPTNFSKGNQFETIKLNDNQLEGTLPHSLSQCTKLEILDLGNNNIDDTFPMWLETLQELQVLSLRSNEFHGTITSTNTKNSFPKLRIFDISDNNFSGPLPISLLKKFQGMMNVSYNKIGLQYMRKNSYYNDSVVVIIKGFSMELIGILTTFTTIDLSNNMFEGEIPLVMGELISLKGLNLSNNEITGNIPQSLSNLRNLEWLDLSKNQLMGEIPTILTNLTFLSFLNLSQNHLEGMIPKGKQFDTFENSSYNGNAMLCGFPLSQSCTNDEDQQPHSTTKDEEESGFGWKAVVTGYVCGATFGLLLGYNVFFLGKPQGLVIFFEHMFNVRLKRTHKRASENRRRMN